MRWMWLGVLVMYTGREGFFHIGEWAIDSGRDANRPAAKD